MNGRSRNKNNFGRNKSEYQQSGSSQRWGDEFSFNSFAYHETPTLDASKGELSDPFAQPLNPSSPQPKSAERAQEKPESFSGKRKREEYEEKEGKGEKVEKVEHEPQSLRAVKKSKRQQEDIHFSWKERTAIKPKVLEEKKNSVILSHLAHSEVTNQQVVAALRARLVAGYSFNWDQIADYIANMVAHVDWIRLSIAADANEVSYILADFFQKNYMVAATGEILLSKLKKHCQDDTQFEQAFDNYCKENKVTIEYDVDVAQYQHLKQQKRLANYFSNGKERNGNLVSPVCAAVYDPLSDKLILGYNHAKPRDMKEEFREEARAKWRILSEIYTKIMDRSAPSETLAYSDIKALVTEIFNAHERDLSFAQVSREFNRDTRYRFDYMISEIAKLFYYGLQHNDPMLKTFLRTDVSALVVLMRDGRIAHEENMHAEQNILKYLIKRHLRSQLADKSLTRAEQIHPLPAGATLSVGVSMFCCASCAHIIEAFNKHYNAHKTNPAKIQVQGTHNRYFIGTGGNKNFWDILFRELQAELPREKAEHDRQYKLLEKVIESYEDQFTAKTAVFQQSEGRESELFHTLTCRRSRSPEVEVEPSPRPKVRKSLHRPSDASTSINSASSSSSQAEPLPLSSATYGVLFPPLSADSLKNSEPQRIDISPSPPLPTVGPTLSSLFQPRSIVMKWKDKPAARHKPLSVVKVTG